MSDLTTDLPVLNLLLDIAERLERLEATLARLEAEFEQYRYLLPDKDSITGRALAGKARRAQRRQGA